MTTPTDRRPKFSEALLAFRAAIQHHADSIREPVEIDYHLQEGRPIRMRFLPGASAESPESPAAKPQAPATPPQAAPAAPDEEWPPLSVSERLLFAQIIREAVRSLPPKDLAAHLRKFPQDRHFL
jgi:hypothetical protein